MSWYRRIALTGVVVAVALVAALLPAGPAPVQDTKPGDTMSSSLANALGLTPSKTNLLTHSLAATNAAGAWEELRQAMQHPPVPDDWQMKDPSPEEAARYLLPYVLALADKSKDFYTRFSTDTNALDAKQVELKALSGAVEFGATNQQARLDAAEKGVLADPNLPEEDRFAIRHQDIEKAVHAKEADG